VACLVCLDGEGEPGDDIILCDLCNSAFHQSCYGSDLLNLREGDDSRFYSLFSSSHTIQKGEWLCERCSHLYKNDLPSQTIKCLFCPEMKEPMKRLLANSFDLWGHIACVNWIPEIYWENDIE